MCITLKEKKKKELSTSLMHSGPSKDGLPIAAVTGYQTWKQKYLIYPCSKETLLDTACTGRNLTRSFSSYGLSTESNLEEPEPISHVSTDSLSPKITGILSVMTDG